MADIEQPTGIKLEGSIVSNEFAVNNDQPPVVDPPVNNDPPPVNNAPIVNDNPPTVTPFEERWKQEFGEVDTNTVKERFAKYDSIAQENEQLKQRPTYRTEAGKKIDEWISAGVKLETIARFSNLKLEELSDDQAIKLKSEIENTKWEPKHIEADFNFKYTYTPDELKSDEENAMQQNLREAAKIQAAAGAKDFLQNYLNNQFNPSGELDAARQKEVETKGQLTQTWTANVPVLTNAAKEVKDNLVFKVPTDKGEENVTLPYRYAVPENDLKALTDLAVQSAVNAGIQPTVEGTKQVSEYLQGMIWAKFGPKIVQAALTDAMSKQQESFAKIIHNPAIPDSRGNVTQGAQSFEQALLNAELKRSGR